MKNNKKSGAKPLTLRERIEIEHKYRYGASIPEIAKCLDRHKSTIYREIDELAEVNIELIMHIDRP